ncbi:MAG: LptF/LptG family permease [Gemmatimonadota bacterium]|nr:LptF/LptG family permease [Gemmatimonadota bacterium]
MSDMSDTTALGWALVYRVVLHLLPSQLRGKHGAAMEALFARELGRARARGAFAGAVAGLAGLSDVIRRGAYERVRAGRDAATKRLLRRHAVSFLLAFVLLTASLLARFAMRHVPVLRARGASAGAIVDALLFAVPFLAAMTIPMAVLLAVLHQLTPLGGARRARPLVRPLVLPLIVVAAGVAAMELVLCAELVPRANERLAAALYAGDPGQHRERSEREMALGELRKTLRDTRVGADVRVRQRAAMYAVEIQKKFALGAACIVMAVTGLAVAIRVSNGGAAQVIGASCVVFGAYYGLFMIGEDLADRLIISPTVGMWGANALLFAAALLAMWRPRRPSPLRQPAVAIRD